MGSQDGTDSCKNIMEIAGRICVQISKLFEGGRAVVKKILLLVGSSNLSVPFIFIPRM
jgi:hypothetical protein